MKIRYLDGEKLSLQNDGALELFFLGVGNAFTKLNYQTNLLIIKGKDHVLVDCGTKCTQALYELGVSITDVEHFLITHSHADHIGGLEEACLLSRYSSKKKPAIVIDETYQHLLWDLSLRGGCAFSEEKSGSELSFGNFWNIIRPRWLQDYPRETLEADVGGINLKLFRTKHIPENAASWETSFWSCGLVIDDRVMFTSDTRFDAELIQTFEKRFKFEHIFHDCQFFNGGVHAGLEEIATLPAAVKKKTTLTHYGDNWKKFEPRVAEAGFAGLAKQHVFYRFE